MLGSKFMPEPIMCIRECNHLNGQVKKFKVNNGMCFSHEKVALLPKKKKEDTGDKYKKKRDTHSKQREVLVCNLNCFWVCDVTFI